MPTEPEPAAVPGVFRTTHWSMVLAAGNIESPDSQAALARLCQIYWYPLYCCVRRQGHSPDDAHDLTQAFFAKILAKNQLSLADPERGRFRTFLLRSLENFLRNHHRDHTTQKRGGGQEIISWDAQRAEGRYASEPSCDVSPATLFERDWADAVLEEVFRKLRQEFSVAGQLQLFEALEPHLWRDDTAASHARIAQELGMTAVAVRVSLHRLRQRFQQMLRTEIAQTVGSADAVEDELRHLRRVLGRS